MIENLIIGINRIESQFDRIKEWLKPLMYIRYSIGQQI